MNSAKTKHYVNPRTAFPSLHSTPSIYSMLSASVWSIICKWLIAVVPFYLEYSQQGGFKENSTGQGVQEKAWSVNQKEYDIPWGEVTFFNITYCKSLHVDALSLWVSLQPAHFAASLSVIFSFILQLFLSAAPPLIHCVAHLQAFW